MPLLFPYLSDPQDKDSRVLFRPLPSGSSPGQDQAAAHTSIGMGTCWPPGFFGPRSAASRPIGDVTLPGSPG